MTSLIAQYGIIIVAAIIFFGELGFPTLVPGEIALAIAGSQVIHSPGQLALAALGFGTVDIIATSLIHSCARTGGNRLLIRLLTRFTRGNSRHEDALARWRSCLRGQDAAAVFATRMIPMFRLYASITAGLVRIRMRHFLLGAAPASLLWAAIPLVLGYTFRSRIHVLQAHYALMMQGIIALSIGTTVLAAGTWAFRRKRLAPARLRRIRIVLGTAVIAGATSRLGLVAAGGGVGRPPLPLPPLPTLSVWTLVLTTLTISLLAVVAHDVRRFRCRHGRNTALGRGGAVTWLGLLVLVTAFSSVVGVQPHAA